MRLAAVLCLMGLSASAQFLRSPVENFSMNWNEGAVIFATGDTVSCQVRYNLSATHSTLQIKGDDTILTILPKDVKVFSFFDPSKKKVRSFSSLKLEPYVPGNEMFVETLYDDARFRILNHRTYGIPYEYMEYTRFISRPVKMSKRYILDLSTGELLPMSKENLLRLITKRKTEIAAFINKHNLKFKKVADYIALLQFHHSL